MAKHRYLAPPQGFGIKALVHHDDAERLRSLAHEMAEPNNKDYHDAMESATLKELQEFFITNGWSFQTKPALKKAGLWGVASGKEKPNAEV